MVPVPFASEVLRRDDPRRRPASATRKASLERRVRKYMTVHPGASRVEATAWAERPKKVRKALLRGAAA